MAISRKRWFACVTLGSALLVAGLIRGIIASNNYFDPFDDLPFERSAWINGDDTVRRAMARDAIRRISAGMPEGEVIGLLGAGFVNQSPHQLTGSAPRFAVRTRSYSLGSTSLTSWQGLDDAYLWVHVSEDSRVIVAEIGGG